MPKSGFPHPPELRQETIDLVRGGRTAGELFRESQPSARPIHNWVLQAEGDAGRRADSAPGAHCADKAPS